MYMLKIECQDWVTLDQGWQLLSSSFQIQFEEKPLCRGAFATKGQQ